MKSCKEIAELMVPGTNRSLMQKVSINMHTLMCKGCRIYQKHMNLITTSYRYHIEQHSQSKDNEIRDFEDQIIKNISTNGHS